MSKVSREEFEWLKRNTKESLGKLFERFYKLEAAIEEIKKGTRHKVGELWGIDIISDPDCKEPHFEKPQPKAEPVPLPLNAEIERILGNEVDWGGFCNDKKWFVVLNSESHSRRPCRPFSTDVATALEGLREYSIKNHIDSAIQFRSRVYNIWSVWIDISPAQSEKESLPLAICNAIKADHARRKP
jgi:hypothetical protein